MSEWTIWGYKAHLILEVDGRMIEVLDPVTQVAPHRSPELDFQKILDAAEASKREDRPKFREVKLDGR